MPTCAGSYLACHIARNTPADFWAMIGALLLFFSLVYAGMQFGFLANTERNKQTFILMDKFLQGGNDSPSNAFKTLDEHSPDSAFITSTGGEILNAWVKGQNYIDEVEDLLKRNIVNADLFLNRYHKIIARAVQLYDKWHKDIITTYVDD